MKDEKLKVLFIDEGDDGIDWLKDAPEPEDAYNDSYDDEDEFVTVLDIYRQRVDDKFNNDAEYPSYDYMNMDKNVYECHIPETAGEVRMFNRRVKKDPKLTDEDMLIGIRRDGTDINNIGDDEYDR